MNKETKSRIRDEKTKEWIKRGCPPSLIIKKEHALNLIKKYATKEAKILDIGCGKNWFVKQLKENDYSLSLGVDKEDSDITCDITKEIPFKDNSFDLVTAWEVMEHLENPRGAVREIHRILNKEGYFILSMPNIFSWGSRVEFFLHGDMPKYKSFNDHYNIFTHTVFEKIFLNHFKLIDTNYYEKYNKLPFFARWYDSLSSKHIVYILKKK